MTNQPQPHDDKSLGGAPDETGEDRLPEQNAGSEHDASSPEQGADSADSSEASPQDAQSGATAPGQAGKEASSGAGASENQQAENANEASGAARPEDVARPEGNVTGDEESEELEFQWYILKVQVNREESIRRALDRRMKIAQLEDYFGDVVVPTEDVAEFNKSGKRRVVKKKLYPGYLMINMVLNDDTWFLVRETPGIGDFTGSAGKPTPMEPHEVQRIVTTSRGEEEGEAPVKTAIPYKPGDRIRVKEGYFENFEGDVDTIDEANGRITVMINIFGRSTPVELEHWQVESV